MECARFVSMKPTVGRIVHYCPTEGERYATMGEPIAAIIVKVWSDECVNLKLFTDSDIAAHMSSVPFDIEHGEMSWNWPPRS